MICPRSSKPRGSQPALQRRSDQSSRRIFGRWMAQVIGPGIIQRRCNSAGRRKRQTEHGCRKAGEAFCHAGRHQYAFVAIDRRRSFARATRHVACHFTGRCRHGHIVRHRGHQSIRRRAGQYGGPGQRRQYQPCNREDREQPAYGDLAVHIHKIPQMTRNGKPTWLTTP
jgi:hypothetical protein